MTAPALHKAGNGRSAMLPIDLATEPVPRRRNDGRDRNRDNSVEALAAKANAAHLAHCRAKGEAVRFATECGEALLTLKDLVGHGRWLAWVKKMKEKGILTFSERTARYYMQLAELPEAKRQRVADLSLRKAIELLSEPQPKQPSFRPSLNPFEAVLQNALLAIAGDGVMNYINDLKQWPNPAALDQLDEAFGLLKQKLVTLQEGGNSDT
jgi:hypothetical protein